jgi:hypothetical protein
MRGGACSQARVDIRVSPGRVRGPWSASIPARARTRFAGARARTAAPRSHRGPHGHAPRGLPDPRGAARSARGPERTM